MKNNIKQIYDNFTQFDACKILACDCIHSYMGAF
jgi:hypothetical protein